LDIDLLKVFMNGRQAPLNEGFKNSLIQQSAMHGGAIISRQKSITDHLQQPEALLF
jgi:hypothetical protein